MHVFIPLLLVFKCLANQMTTVGSRIDQYIFRFFLKASLDHSFQIFIFNLKLLKRKVIHIDNKLVVTVFDLL